MSSVKYHVYVKPGSKKGPLIEEKSDGLTVFLRERPIDGAANEALIKVLAQHFDIAKSQVKIKAGANNRHKVVEIFS